MINPKNHSSESGADSPKTTRKQSHAFWRLFWLSFLVLSLAYAWYSFYVPSNKVSWSYDMEQAQKLAEESDKKMMLFFTGEWCVPCRIMKREVFSDKEVLKLINDELVPVLIDIDEAKWKKYVKLYNIGTTPITIFTDGEGNVIDYAVGKINKEKFVKMVQALST